MCRHSLCAGGFKKLPFLQNRLHYNHRHVWTPEENTMFYKYWNDPENPLQKLSQKELIQQLADKIGVPYNVAEVMTPKLHTRPMGLNANGTFIHQHQWGS